MKGFRDTCLAAGTTVNGGQTVRNPWMIIGGVASSVCRSTDYIMLVGLWITLSSSQVSSRSSYAVLFALEITFNRPDGAVAGDVLVLTKPLGTQVAVNAHQWLGTPKFERIASVCSPEAAVAMYRMSMYSMTLLNREAASK